MTVLGYATSIMVDRLGGAGFATTGAPAARLLAGPPRECGSETFSEHRSRLGPLELPLGHEHAIGIARSAGLLGRGGGEFPFSEKLRAASAGHGAPLIVVNGSEGEPASRKDRELLELRPHLVLDGASWAAAAIGAPQAVIYLEAGRGTAWQAVRHALRERRMLRISDPEFLFKATPDCYIAGESTAVVAVLEGRGPLPGRRPTPVASAGVGGRPTVVSNVETLAHLALIARFGPDWFRQAGSPGAPGSTLVTLAGEVSAPGLVLEVLEPVPFGRILGCFSERGGGPQAVLIGGYGGRWVGGDAMWNAPLERAALKAAGCGLGCGMLGVISQQVCGLALTYRILDYLAGESAGQCGSCVYGLPSLVEELGALVAGRGGRRAPDRLLTGAIELEGRGGCGHPDGAAGLLQSALNTFSVDAGRHARRRPCGRGVGSGWFPAALPGRRLR